MCPCIKFQSIWWTLDLAQICPKLYEWQNFEKLDIEIIISTQQCTPLSNLSLFEESLLDYGTKFAQKTWVTKILER